MKALQVLAVVCLVAAAGRAEDKPDYAKMIVGKWEVTKADPGTLPMGALVEFAKDGKFKALEKEDAKEPLFEGTYKVDGDKFDLDIKMGDQSFKITINIVKLTDTEMHTKNAEGNVVEVKRKK